MTAVAAAASKAHSTATHTKQTVLTCGINSMILLSTLHSRSSISTKEWIRGPNPPAGSSVRDSRMAPVRSKARENGDLTGRKVS